MATESGTQPGAPASPAEQPVPRPAAGSPARPPGPSGLAPGLGMEEFRAPIYAQGIVVSVIVAALVLVLAIIAAGSANANPLPVAQTTNPLFWVLAVLVIVGAGLGAQFAERTAARAALAVGQPRPPTSMATAWCVPAVATFAAIFLVATYHSNKMLIVGPVIAFLGNAGALLSRDLLDDAGEMAHRTATTIHTLVIHAVAFLALSAVYLNKMSSWISAPLAGLIGGLLVLETLERGGADRSHRIIYAILGGAALAEAMLALNWWPTHGWTGGAVLLVCFYLVAGVLLTRTQRATLRTRDLVEFGLVSLIAFVVLTATS